MNTKLIAALSAVTCATVCPAASAWSLFGPTQAEKDAARAKVISVSQIKLDDVVLDGPSGLIGPNMEYRISGRAFNGSKSHDVATLGFVVAQYDCSAKPCKEVDSSTVEVTAPVPAGSVRRFHGTFYLPDVMPRGVRPNAVPTLVYVRVP